MNIITRLFFLISIKIVKAFFSIFSGESLFSRWQWPWAPNNFPWNNWKIMGQLIYGVIHKPRGQFVWYFCPPLQLWSLLLAYIIKWPFGQPAPPPIVHVVYGFPLLCYIKRNRRGIHCVIFNIIVIQNW